MQEDTRYWLRVGTLAWQQATETQFISAERGAGFYPKSGNGVATGGFGGSGIEGRVTYGEVTAKKYPHDLEFVRIAERPATPTAA